MPITVRQRSIHAKNGAKKLGSFNKGKKSKKGNDGEYLVTNAPTDLKGITYPGGAVALVLLLSARIFAALWGHIDDCDETYNYWEPLHYLIYGSGLQTWEYSPVYAIRSYAPLWLFAVPGKILHTLFYVRPVMIFYFLRIILAVLSALADLIFYKAVCCEFGVHVGRTWLAFIVPPAGSFVSSSAMLPSAWSGALATASLACWWRRRAPAAIFLTAANALLSWPFAALLGLPIAVDLLIYRRQIWEFSKWCLISLVMLLGPAVAIDSWHYGRLVIAPWNIVAYNIFTEHGPDLYGVEPWTYYFVNGFLNFNIIWVLALSCPLFLVACAAVTPHAAPRASFCRPYWLSLAPLYLWLAVFMLQPHKEERFLYPVYSMIALSGAVALDCVQKMFYAFTSLFRTKRSNRRSHYLAHTVTIMWICAFIAAITGVSRIVSLYNNYHGPMTILRDLPDGVSEEPVNVCFGKDWHRSPSSFHLPSANYRIRFIPSEFKGQLPAQYEDSWNATRIIQPYFNDNNKGDNRTYLNPSDCHYLVDSNLGTPSELEPAYAEDNATWEKLAKVNILDAARSHKIFRAYYVPVYSELNNVFGSLFLLRNKLI